MYVLHYTDISECVRVCVTHTNNIQAIRAEPQYITKLISALVYLAVPVFPAPGPSFLLTLPPSFTFIQFSCIQFGLHLNINSTEDLHLLHNRNNKIRQEKIQYRSYNQNNNLV